MPAALAYSPDTDIVSSVPNTTFDFEIASVGVGTLLFNSTSILAAPAMLNTMYDSLVQIASQGAVGIEGSMQSLPFSNKTSALISSFISLFASIMILIPFAFVAAQFIVPLARERESGSKQMQFISGVGPIIYWVGNWAWDGLLYLVILVCTLIVFVMRNRTEFTGTPEAIAGTTLILLLFGFAVVPLASVASFRFTSPSNGLIVMIAFYFLTGFGLNIANFILQAIGGTSEDVNKVLVNLYRFFPAYCLGEGFFTMSTRQAEAQLVAFGKKPPGLYEWEQLGGPLAYLFIEGLVCMAATLFLQYAESDIYMQQRLQNGLFPSRRAPVTPVTTTTPLPATPSRAARWSRESISELEDADVIDERRAIDAEGGGDSQLVIKHLRREFGPKVAVRDLCLRIERGECFGFLGVNGAGKSTTFSMLTGSLVPTSGDALLEGMSILKEQDKIRRLVGYCPQHDALEKLLTGREALRMYAKIKLVDPSTIEAEIEDLIQDLDLVKFADKPCGTYSGGNKRKLCVGIALVGSPQLVLLDEPSSGMDAASKRFLWSVIKRRTASCCTVLTTHSMEECEALCGRIGVMVDGTLRCLGPIQTLKSTYGQGYKLDLRLDTMAEPEAIAEMLRSRVGEVDLKELEPPSMVLTVPQNNASLSQLFGLLSELKATHHVLECSVTQCTLEQIFIQMASKTQMRNIDAVVG